MFEKRSVDLKLTTKELIKLPLKDRFSGLSHAIGALLAVAGLVTLICLSHGDPLRMASFGIYGGTLVMLYVASALYHSLHVGERIRGALYGFDRAAIYALIAGTYTPVCLIGLGGGWGLALLAAVWTCAIAGILIDVISRQRAPDWLQAVMYLVTGWMVVIALGPLVRSVSLHVLIWLAAGCVIYTVGAVVCVTERPRLRPGIFGAHDLWHALVMVASACHFAMMLLIAVG